MWISLKKVKAKTSGAMWFKIAWSFIVNLLFPIIIYYLMIRLEPKEFMPYGNIVIDSLLNFIHLLHRFMYYSTITLFGQPQNITSITVQGLVVSIIIYAFLRRFFKGLIISMLDIALVVVIYLMLLPEMTIVLMFDIPVIDAGIEISILPIYQLILIGVICINILEVNVIIYEYQHPDCYHINFFNENSFTTIGDLNEARKINEEFRIIENMRKNEIYCKENPNSEACTAYDVLKRHYDLPDF